MIPPAAVRVLKTEKPRSARAHSRHIEELGSAYEQSVSSGAKPAYHARVTQSRSPKKGRSS